MKNLGKSLSLIIATLFVVAAFTQCKNSDANNTFVSANDSTCNSAIKIAYVNTDSLLKNYNLAKELNDEMLKQQESMRANVNERGKALEKEMAEFQRKYENNAFLSPDRAQQEYQRISNEEAKLQEYVQKLEMEALQNSQKMVLRVNDSVQNYIDEVLSKAYDIVLNNAGTLHVAKKFDITDEVVKGLNARYKK
ncbi:MAG: OmpH family outer membrane protein [Muribaculaceae bacterium]|nr:OmpH family outer membrane protein [Muribaculaceae bacterium]